MPFWTSYLLRVMAWKLMLGPTGVVNSLLLGAGLISEPLDALLYNRPAVIITLIYVWIPFAALPILAGLQRVDASCTKPPPICTPARRRLLAGDAAAEPARRARPPSSWSSSRPSAST